jgi:RNA polymerase sigma-70 factor (ECF subfamily)
MYTTLAETYAKNKKGGGILVQNKIQKDGNLDLSILMAEKERALWIAYRATKSVALAEDAIQEAYASIIRNPPECNGMEHLRNCFLTAVRKQALTLLRGEKRRKKRESLRASAPTAWRMAPEEKELADELAWAARAALGDLPQDEREVVSLCCEQGFTREEVAKILAIPKPTVTLRVNRGLAKLRKILAKQGYAAATPLAVGTALSSLPLPPLSESLIAALQNIAANPAAYVPAQTIAHSVRTTGSFSAKIIWGGVAVFICSISAGGIWLWSNSESPGTETAMLEKPSDALKLSGIEDGKTPMAKTDKFFRRWSFRDGPSGDINPYFGKWGWVKGKDGTGGMEVVKDVPGAYVSFALPVEIPARPFRIALKGNVRDPKKTFYWGVHLARKPNETLPYKSWSKVGSRRMIERVDIVCCVIDRWAISSNLQNEADMITCKEYDESYPATQLSISFDNLLLEEIELRELEPQEIEKYGGILKAKLQELEKAGVKMKEVRGLRVLPDGKMEEWQ